MRQPRSVAMTAEMHKALGQHLLRPDGQEDVCIATYSVSSGTSRTSALLRDVILPREGEREVHGNVSFTGQYVTRAAVMAAQAGLGIVVLHSHPSGRGWQGMSGPDKDAEASYAFLAHRITGLPLLGMTLAGDSGWSVRSWNPQDGFQWGESVRVIGDRLRVSWNDHLLPPPPVTAMQHRTVTAWGEAIHRDIVRSGILIVGLGSVGLDLALRLAAAGFTHIGLMDFDGVEVANLDRMIGATRLDALLRRSKVEVAARLVREASTASELCLETFDMSVCTDEGMTKALDFDVIFSCVDRPWSRAVLNTLAYSDLVPVIDGGIAIDAFSDGGMRNATWRSHVLRPGRPCLACNGQLEMGSVTVDQQGFLDDPAYIAGLPQAQRPQRQNVSLLSVNVVSSLLGQFVSLMVSPGGRGEPGPLQHVLSTHTVRHRNDTTRAHCPFEQAVAVGDGRTSLTGPHDLARVKQEERRQAVASAKVKKGRALADRLDDARQALEELVGEGTSL